MIDDSIELNVSKADTNLCIVCKEFIATVYRNGKRVRDNRIDCEDEDNDLISYHLRCYDMEFFGHVTEYTLRKEKEYESR